MKNMKNNMYFLIETLILIIFLYIKIIMTAEEFEESKQGTPCMEQLIKNDKNK